MLKYIFDMLNAWMSTKSALHDTVSKTKATFKFGLDDEKDIETMASQT